MGLVLNRILIQEQVRVEKLSSGNPFGVTYILELEVDGATTRYGFSGWPDFILHCRHSDSHRLRPRPRHRRHLGYCQKEAYVKTTTTNV